jgi:hypothetical protein
MPQERLGRAVRKTKISCVTRLTLHNSTAIVGETPDTQEYTFAVAIMPNLKGHTDSIKNSQFKAAWQSGPTRTIRVPIALADATLEYARQLDRCTKPRDTSDRVDTGAEIPPAVEPRDTSDRVDTGAEIPPAVEPRDTSILGRMPVNF